MAPILNENALEFISRSHKQTQRLGARLGTLLRGGDLVCLEGPLGSGKTCLAQGIGRGWGIGQTLTSPTFVLVREYTRTDEPAIRFYHVDLYRVSGTEEAFTLGMDEFIGDEHAISVVEWAERASDIMPQDYLWITLDITDHTQRTLHFSATGKRHKRLLHEFRQAAFGA